MSFIDTNPSAISLTEILHYFVCLYTDEAAAAAAKAKSSIRTRNFHYCAESSK